MQGFRYHPEIITRFPNIVAGVLMISDAKFSPTYPELQAAYLEEQKATLEKIGQRSFAEFPTLAAWRSAFREFGVDPTQYRSAPEALLRRLRQDGNIPFINPLVDIGNMISIRYMLPLAIIDTEQLEGFVTVRFSDGTESHNVLGDDEVKHPDKGEVIFVDDKNVVLARRWCWRQTQQSAVKESTSRAIVVIEAQHPNSRDEINAAQGDLIMLLNAHLNVSLISGVVDKSRPSMPS